MTRVRDARARLALLDVFAADQNATIGAWLTQSDSLRLCGIRIVPNIIEYKLFAG